jgi:hypothetical protein
MMGRKRSKTPLKEGLSERARLYDENELLLEKGVLVRQVASESPSAPIALSLALDRAVGDKHAGRWQGLLERYGLPPTPESLSL